jgi:hypothetical protein
MTISFLSQPRQVSVEALIRLADQLAIKPLLAAA